jgi:hypothetical protein
MERAVKWALGAGRVSWGSKRLEGCGIKRIGKPTSFVDNGLILYVFRANSETGVIP